ncbi:hypothetical protein [Lentzea sp. NPDC059081]|uniref:hypothetical protein n=1 Tax=Lentzea sp. NPDC059081 TaxID=3346719 RepID=UPI0036752343
MTHHSAARFTEPPRHGIDAWYQLHDDTGGNVHDDHFSRRRRRYGGRPLTGAPLWIKVVVWVGTLLAIAGFGVLGFDFLTALETPSPPMPAFPGADRQFTPPSPAGPHLGLGFGLFFAGFVLSAIGTLANNTRR